MDICSSILEKSDYDNEKENEKIFNLVLQDFFYKIGFEINFGNDQLSSIAKAEILKQQYIYISGYIDVFFEILKKYNYNMIYEIKDAIFYLGNLENPSKNKKVIEKLLNSPEIQDISFYSESKYTILSEKYGKFDIELAKQHFRNNEKINNYIENSILVNHCHQNSFFLSKVFPNYYSITSLCSRWFKGRYYHSYTYNQDDNVIIDLCNNSIIDKNQYYKIFDPNELSIVLNSNIVNELAITEYKTKQPANRCKLLQIALYKQYLNSIGYQGSLEDAPVITKKI